MSTRSLIEKIYSLSLVEDDRGNYPFFDKDRFIESMEDYELVPKSRMTVEEILDIIDFHECHHGVPRAVYASEFEHLAKAIIEHLKGESK